MNELLKIIKLSTKHHLTLNFILNYDSFMNFNIDITKYITITSLISI